MFEPQTLVKVANKTRGLPVWPLPALNGREPVLIVHDTKIPGLDLAYERAHDSELVERYPVDSANGSAKHFMPNLMPAFAVSDGVITYAGNQHHGHAIVIDHRNGWASYYANLEHMFARPTNRDARPRSVRVKSGDVLGYVGAPTAGAMKCLHFELWKLDEAGHFEPVGDTLQHMRSWLMLPWTNKLTPSNAALARIAA